MEVCFIMKSNFLLKKVVLGVLVMLFIMWNCALNKNPIATVVESHSENYSIFVNVNPPTSYRTTGNWNAWTTPITVKFESNLEDGIEDTGHDDGGHADKAAAEETEDILVGRKTINGIEISLHLGAGQDMFTVHDGEIEEHHADYDDHHFRVTLTDALGEHSPHGGQNVAYTQVHLVADNGTEEFEIPLLPVQGPHGVRFENNYSLAAGTYTLGLEASAPGIFRHDHTKNYWNSHIDIELGSFDYTNGFSGGTIATVINGEGTDSEIKATLRGGSVKTYGAMGTGMVPLNGDENINFSLRLEDADVEAYGGEFIYYANVSVSIKNQETGKEVWNIIEPCYDEKGFSYCGNIKVPAGETAAEEPDGHDDDEDAH